MRRYANGIKTAVLLGLMTALILSVGYWLAGRTGIVIAAVLSTAMNAVSYFFSDRIALRAVHARRLGPDEAPELWAMVRELAQEVGQPLPRLHISPIAQPNAFATGRGPRHAAVVVTSGILKILTPRELRAVLAHELSHVYNRDILISSVAAALAGILTATANLAFFLPSSSDDDGPNPLGMLFLMIVGPVAAGLIRLAISRNREYQADQDGARISGDPAALASALRKIDAVARRRPMPADGAHASTAHLMIANPLSGRGFAALFSTHPPTEDRVRRLCQLVR